MKIVTSAQSGTWSNGTTWEGGMVPNLVTDAVRIATGHTVDIATTDTLSLVAPRSITVQSNALLVIYGHLSVEDSSALAIAGLLMIGEAGVISMQNSTITVDGGLVVGPGGTLAASISSYLNLHTGCSASIFGSLSMDDVSYLTVEGGLTIEPGSMIALAGTASVTVGNGGTMHVRGDVTMSGSANMACGDGGDLIIDRDATVLATETSNLRALLDGRLDVIGRLSGGSGTTIDIDAGGSICVWREITCDGSLGIAGQLVMRRREAGIRRSDGTALVSVDKTYGYGQR